MKIYLPLTGSPSAIAAFLATVPVELQGSDTAYGQGVADTLNGAPNVAFAQPVGMTGMPTLSQSDDDDGDDGEAPAGAPDFDSAGMPWDERIHAKSKGVSANGTWRRRKGVAQATVDAVEAELKGRPAVPMPPVPVTTATMPVPVQGIPAMPPVEMPAMPSMPAMPPVEIPAMVAAPPVAAPAPVAGPMDGASFMAHLTTLMQGGKVTMADLQGKVAEFNGAWAAMPGYQPINAVTDLLTDPAKIDYMVKLLQGAGKW